MMDPILIAGLACLIAAGIVVAIWWALTAEMELRARLALPRRMPGASPVMLLRTAAADRFPLLAQIAAAFPWIRRLERLTEQAGWAGRSGEALGVIAAFTVIGGVIGAARMEDWVWGIAWAALGGMLPVLYLRLRHQRRVEKFSEQFPEALDMMTRSLRAGHALVSSLQMVAEEMPHPVAAEFRRVFEQISLGRPPNESLREMYERIQTEEVRFFYVAVGVQRDVGGNLAEILEKLSEVIRERFKLLAFARMISVQQRMSAYCVAASPFLAAFLLSFLRQGWFDPLWDWPYGKAVVFVVLMLQVVGFYFLRRVANITV
jgi:tight adherence protein B